MCLKPIIYILLSVSLFGNNNVNSTKFKTTEDDEKMPLHNKKYGIEINPIFLLISKKDDMYISGTFSFFDISRKIELAFPFQYILSSEEVDFERQEYENYRLDSQVKYFLDRKQKGIYLAVG